MIKPLGEAAVHLPWLSPCAASLLALSRAPGPALWSAVCADPGCVLLLARHPRACSAAAGVSLFPALLRDAGVLEAALYHLQEKRGGRAGPDGWVDWKDSGLQPILQASLTCANLAHQLANRTAACDPENAWVAGLFAPLGWLAAAGADPGATAACLSARPCRFDSAAVARRLSRDWHLPGWLAAVSGHLGLPVEVAIGLGAEPALFRLIQLVVGLVERQGGGVPLAVAAAPESLLGDFTLARAEAEAECTAAIDKARQAVLDLSWQSPRELPLLPDLLRLAAENRRLGGLPMLDQFQDDMDVLHAAVEVQHRGEEQRLRERKLAALAEFAAGASHEINNPLAVISGQAQYLLKKVQSGETLAQNDPSFSSMPAEFGRSLQTIVGQTQRIHQILGDLMQFARPPAPQKRLVDVGGMIQEVAAALESLAGERKVQLVCSGPAAPVTLHADPVQLYRALVCLLRNGIEAAPANGWAGVRVELTGHDRLELVIEDNGRGPAAADREHLFDPFYSGRKAGRGRGLGLPTAWRLAREHGGDVHLAATEPGLTRFVLGLPLSTDLETLPEANGLNGCPIAATIDAA